MKLLQEQLEMSRRVPSTRNEYNYRLRHCVSNLDGQTTMNWGAGKSEICKNIKLSAKRHGYMTSCPILVQNGVCPVWADHVTMDKSVSFPALSERY